MNKAAFLDLQFEGQLLNHNSQIKANTSAMSDICQKGKGHEKYRRFKIGHRDPEKVVGDERRGKKGARKKCMMKGREQYGG